MKILNTLRVLAGLSLAGPGRAGADWLAGGVVRVRVLCCYVAPPRISVLRKVESLDRASM